MKERDIYRAALEKFGADSQILMVFEEMAELQKELCKHSRGAGNVDHIAEEIADVQIMLEQMIVLHDCRAMVRTYKAAKIKQLHERLVFREVAEP